MHLYIYIYKKKKKQRRNFDVIKIGFSSIVKQVMIGSNKK